MECDASVLFADNGDLFASSDDEVEVTPMQSTVSSSNELISKPVSSNNTNSTAPSQYYEVNVSPLHQPSSSRTPVPEEYQPLPDSSSTFDYSAGHVNPDSSNTTEPRSIPPDINIRYQPKPQYWGHQLHQRSIGEWRHTSHPNRELYNNYVVLHNLRGSYNPPIYTMASIRAQMRRDENTTTEPESNPELSEQTEVANASNTETTNDNSMPINLERPSRKLNISPRRRQSKEAETSNLIELSSEEEDNAPRKKQCDNGAHYSRNRPQGSEQSGSGTRPLNLNVKGEPHDLSISSRHTETNISNNPQSNRRTHTSSNNHRPGHIQEVETNPHDPLLPAQETRLGYQTSQSMQNNMYGRTVKRETAEPVFVNWARSGRLEHSANYRPHQHDSLEIFDSTHRHHHHPHHHHHVRPHYHQNPLQAPTTCPVHNISNTSASISAQPPVKEELSSVNRPLVKQESSNNEGQSLVNNNVKVEQVEARNFITFEPKTRSQSPVCKVESANDVTVKAEGNNLTDRRRGSGDRRRVASPQAGPSTVIKSSPSRGTDTNNAQVISYFLH